MARPDVQEVLKRECSFSIMFPADQSGVVVLCNFNNNDTDALFNFVMGIRNIMLAR